jgi:hypothetical protein
MPEVAADAASGTSAAEGVATPDVRSVVATSHIGSRRSPIGIPCVVLWQHGHCKLSLLATGSTVLGIFRL